MKKLWIGLGTFAILILITAAVMLRYLTGHYWQFESSQNSPSSRHTIHHYTYQSDSDRHAPYGSYLFLQKENSRQNPLNGYVIFAGYCSEALQYAWENDNKIVINCKVDKTDSIRTLTSKAYGIAISLK